MQWNTSPYQVSIFVHGHSKRPHAHEKSLIVVINDPLVPLPDDPPLHVILHRKRTNNTSQSCDVNQLKFKRGTRLTFSS